jgi:hypothetical protein
VNRKERVRAAGGNAKETVRHAAEVVGPYAATARESAVHYAHEAGVYLKPRARSAADKAAEKARLNYEAHLAPRLEHARHSLPEGMDEAAVKAAERTRVAARRAREAAAPRLEQARAAAGPAREKAAARSAAAFAGLRGELTPREIRKAVRRRERRARAWGAAKWVGAAGVVAGGAFAVWKWWERQANPDWLVEPPPATEVGDVDPFAVEENSDTLRDPELDPEVEAKQAEADAGGSTAAVPEEEQQPENGADRS